ncbi:hypothetical protein C0Q70_05627 [Pomacea canaliculata]|uniref:Ubiquitin-protein ligase E3A n=1 Tax=Pomacea canaliculata TaxID=400727 RepID=A0A2T7PLQ0_POMCA|nr:hypothetical protein C0Q70_05627 [Pomacea canaliculata]
MPTNIFKENNFQESSEQPSREYFDLRILLETAGNQAALTPADGAGTSSCRSSGNLQDSKDGEHGTENITGTGGAKAKLPSPTNSSTPSSSCSSQSSIDQHGDTHEIKYLDEGKVMESIQRGQRSGSWNHLIHIIGIVFSSPEFLMRSFPTCSVKICESSSVDPDKDFDDTEAEPMHVDQLPTQERCAQKEDAAQGDSERQNTACLLSVDLASLRRVYDALMSIPEQPFQAALINALKSLSYTIQMDFKYHRSLEKDRNFLNIFVIVLEFPNLHSPEYLETAFPSFCKALALMPLKGQARLAQILSMYGEKRLTIILQSLQQLITVRIVNNEGRWGRSFHLNDDDAIVDACCVMKIVYYASLFGGQVDSLELLEEERHSNEADLLHDALQGAMGIEPKEQSQPRENPLGKELKINQIDVRKPLISFEEFINDPLNEHIDISTDYAYYRAEPDNKFSFITHNFVLTTASKHMCMYFDNRIRMLHERRTSLLQTIVHGGPPMPYLRIRVRRDHVVDDALLNLEMVAMDNPGDLKKQLFVEFEGEQGLDEGGVSKEFFQLIVEELFNPDIGMFIYNENTRQFWFNHMSFENEGQFTLIGIVLGLAIYNSCILDIHLPMVVYRKLLGKKGVFQDLFDVDPTLASSLQQMLDYDGGDFEDVFMQTFRIGFLDVFGSSGIHDLKEGGEDITVTCENREEFVDLYADFILNKSVECQFRAFKRGFMMVTNESPLKMLFRPDEVEMLVCGSKEFDFHALETATDYDGGFTADSPTVRNFWDIVHEFSEEDKKKLLQFTTGSDRVPVGGLSKLKFIVARNGPDSDKLPTSHTCFNVLLLPDYATKEKLKERLLKAINYAKGFGML